MWIYKYRIKKLFVIKVNSSLDWLKLGEQSINIFTLNLIAIKFISG